MRIPDLYYCADGNKRFADIALTNGFRYGARLPATIYHRAEFTDQDWKAPNREMYMQAVEVNHPRLATVLDWERPEQWAEVESWAAQIAPFVTEAIVIIPKVMGGIGRIPETIRGKAIRLGYSVPTGYGGTCLPSWEFGSRPVHLLGGSPHDQIELAQYLNVVSADTNYHLGMATRYNQFFAAGGSFRAARNRWYPKLNETALGHIDGDVPYKAFALSCINIKTAWMGSPAAIRYAAESDIPGIKAIANKYKTELGFVNSTALKESVARLELYVAVINDAVVGFVNWHHRRDDQNVVYEIAVHPAFRGRAIGSALLEAVPAPRRLKCTADNTANEFYSRSMRMVGQEPGRKRTLNVWVSPA